MKIKTAKLDYEKVLELPKKPRPKPKKPNILFRILLKIVSTPDLLATRFKYRKIGMEKLSQKEPCFPRRSARPSQPLVSRH